jgi:hypothetical protein
MNDCLEPCFLFVVLGSSGSQRGLIWVFLLLVLVFATYIWLIFKGVLFDVGYLVICYFYILHTN